MATSAPALHTITPLMSSSQSLYKDFQVSLNQIPNFDAGARAIRIDFPLGCAIDLSALFSSI
jgi:hypothetical protein